MGRRGTISAGTRSFLSDVTTHSLQHFTPVNEREASIHHAARWDYVTTLLPCSVLRRSDAKKYSAVRSASRRTRIGGAAGSAARRPITARPRARFVCPAGASTARSFTPNGSVLLARWPTPPTRCVGIGDDLIRLEKLRWHLRRESCIFLKARYKLLLRENV